MSLHVDRQFSTVAVSLKGYRQSFLTQRFVRFTAAVAQQERLEDEAQTGALATLTWRPTRAEGRFGRRMLTNIDLFVAAHRSLSVGVHLKNAFNGYHEYAWFDGATTLHSPGERRAMYVTSTFEF